MQLTTNKTILFVFLVFVLVASGCTKLQYVDELIVLKRIGYEAARMDILVDVVDNKFEEMIFAYQAGTLKTYNTKVKVRRKFGDPIYIRNYKDDADEMEIWVYRKAVKYFGSEKINLYFNEEHDLVRLEHVPAVEKKG